MAIGLDGGNCMHMAMSACDYRIFIVDEVPKFVDLKDMGGIWEVFGLDMVMSKSAGRMKDGMHYVEKGDEHSTLEGGLPVHELH